MIRLQRTVQKLDFFLCFLIVLEYDRGPVSWNKLQIFHLYEPIHCNIQVYSKKLQECSSFFLPKHLKLWNQIEFEKWVFCFRAFAIFLWEFWAILNNREISSTKYDFPNPSTSLRTSVSFTFTEVTGASSSLLEETTISVVNELLHNGQDLLFFDHLQMHSWQNAWLQDFIIVFSWREFMHMTQLSVSKWEFILICKWDWIAIPYAELFFVSKRKLPFSREKRVKGKEEEVLWCFLFWSNFLKRLIPFNSDSQNLMGNQALRRLILV